MPKALLRLTEADLAEAIRLHRSLGRGHRYWLDVLVAVPFVYSILQTPVFWYEGVVLFFALVGAVLGLLVYVLWRARRLLLPRRRVVAPELQEIVWSAEGIASVTRLGACVFRWTHFHQWAADQRVVLLYENTRVFQILPRRIFASFVESLQVENYLAAAGVRRVGPKRRRVD